MAYALKNHCDCSVENRLWGAGHRKKQGKQLGGVLVRFMYKLGK